MLSEPSLDHIESELALRHYDKAVCLIRHHMTLSNEKQPQLEALLLRTQQDRAQDHTEYRLFLRRVVTDDSLLDELQETSSRFSAQTQQFLDSTTFQAVLHEIANEAPGNVARVLKILGNSPRRCSSLLLALKSRDQLISGVYLELGGFICRTLGLSDMLERKKQEVAEEYSYALGKSVEQGRNARHFKSLLDAISSKYERHVFEGIKRSKCFAEILKATANVSHAHIGDQMSNSHAALAFEITATLIHSPNLNTIIQEHITAFIQVQLGHGQPADMCEVLYLVSSLFLIEPAAGLLVLQLEGFLEEVWAEADEFEEMLIPLLEMLSTACLSREAQEIISLNCSDMLLDCIRMSNDRSVRALTTAVLFKIGRIKSDCDLKATQHIVMSLLLGTDDLQQLLRSIETLMFLSTEANFKTIIANNMQETFQAISLLDSAKFNQIVFVLSTLIYNLVDESQRTEETLANRRLVEITSGGTKTVDNAAQTRVQALLDQGLLKVLSLLLWNKNNAVKRYVASILYYVSHVPSTRPSLTQFGAIRFLCDYLQKATNKRSSEQSFECSFAIAKILISVDPSLAFNSSTSSTIDVITPLLPLLCHENSLAVFETTLALTNMTTIGEQECQVIVRSWDDILVNLDSDYSLIRRATTELVCNLVVSEAGSSQFLSPRSTGSLNLLKFIKLTMCDDFETRRAASGAIAVLSYHESASSILIKDMNIFDHILNMLEQSSVEIIRRILILLQNIIAHSRSITQIHLDRLISSVSQHAQSGNFPEVEEMLQGLKTRQAVPCDTE